MTNVRGRIAPSRRYAVAHVLSALLGWGCGSGGDDPPGIKPTPGSPSGVDGGVPGSGSDGEAPRGNLDARGDTPASGGGQAGMAVAKFCNGLALRSGEPLDFTLEIGTPPVIFTAASGKCVPPAGQPCLAIPAGMVKFVLKLNGEPAGLAQEFPITANEDWVFGMTVEDDRVGLRGGVVPRGTCPEFDLDDEPDGGVRPPDGGGGVGPRPGL